MGLGSIRVQGAGLGYLRHSSLLACSGRRVYFRFLGVCRTPLLRSILGVGIVLSSWGTRGAVFFLFLPPKKIWVFAASLL